MFSKAYKIAHHHSATYLYTSVFIDDQLISSFFIMDLYHTTLNMGFHRLCVLHSNILCCLTSHKAVCCEMMKFDFTQVTLDKTLIFFGSLGCLSGTR